jgi:hypothetical protein
MGYKVDLVNEGNGNIRYILIGEPEFIRSKPKSAVDLLLHSIKESFDGNITGDQLIDLLDKYDFRITRKSGFFK